MDANAMQWSDILFRWLHVVAGVMWIGHLYFFNFVNGPLAATYDADSKKKVVPQLMPRALYFFRWGAIYTWVTGFLLLGVVYYSSKVFLIPESSTMSAGMGAGIGVGLLLFSVPIYDMLWKSPLAKNEKVGAAVSFLLIVGVAFGLYQVFTGRGAFIHIGAIFGTLMAANVWMRIWPAQRKIIAAMRDGQAPDAALAGTAKLRSKHNTYMSVPLIYTMVAAHHNPLAYGESYGWAILAGVILVGWYVVSLLYKKAASPKVVAY
jgi:uncharacterized membrane protein